MAGSNWLPRQRSNSARHSSVRETLPVWPPEAHGVVGVDDAHGTRHERDGFAGETIRVARAVPALVMVAHAGNEGLVEERADDIGAEDGVLAHELPLVRVQAARLEEHAVRHADLADVVQVRGLLHGAQELRLPAELSAQQDHVGRYPRGVAERVVVLRVEGAGQGLEVAEVHALDARVQLRVVDREREVRADALEEAAVDCVEGRRAGRIPERGCP